MDAGESTIEQLPESIRAAIFGNVGSLISFRVGHSDSQELSREFGQTFAIETFTSLDRFRVIARLSEDGQTRVSFQGTTLPPIDFQIGRREKLIARSREKYSAKRADVEAKIERWLTGTDCDPRRIRKGRIPFLSARL